MRAGNSKPAIRVLWGDEKTHGFTKSSEDLFSRFCAAACSKTTHQRGGYS